MINEDAEMKAMTDKAVNVLWKYATTTEDIPAEISFSMGIVIGRLRFLDKFVRENFNDT
jgi:hypothetical protein